MRGIALFRSKSFHLDDGQKKLLVVDVNYFPSYKEMSNFPSLLAQYLTEKAVQGRLRSVNK